MNRVQLDKDIKPLSEFRTNAAAILEQIKRDRRPIVITQNGRSSCVMLSVSDYEEMVTRIELAEAIEEAREDVKQGVGISHAEVIKNLRDRLSSK